jgi:MFS family permease
VLASLQRHRNYRLYFAGQFVSQIGTWLQTAAQSWLILELTHSAQAVGVLGFCFYGPYAVLGLLGGALADRWDRRTTLLIGQVAMALCAASLALVVFAHIASVWLIDAIAVVRGTVLVFNNPSRQALIVQLVGRSELGNAIALNSSLNNATRIIGPALAGVLIDTTGLGVCFALNAISFIPVIWAIAVMRTDEFHTQADTRRGGSLLESIRAGLRYARHTKTVAVVLTMMFAVSFLAINFNVLLPVLAQQTMHGGPQTYGWIAAVFGLGALIGALVAAARTRASRTLLLSACAVFGLAQCILAPQHSFVPVAIALLATGVAYTIYTASTNAFVQLATPGFLQGRVGGLYNYVFLASGPLGSLLAGWLCERGGTELAFAAGGIATLAMAVFGLLTNPWPMPTGTVRSRT